jgi:hypothetical protein
MQNEKLEGVIREVLSQLKSSKHPIIFENSNNPLYIL